QGLDAGDGAQLSPWPLQPRALHLRGGGPLRSQGGRGLHPAPRAAAAGVLAAARRNRQVTVVGSGAASGGAQLLPEVLAVSSSLPLDKALVREGGVGAVAH